VNNHAYLPPASAESKLGTIPAIPLWIRLPKSLARCPYIGLSRGTIVGLVLPCAANDNRPPVKSCVIKKKHAVRGVRLVSGPSLAEYLDSIATGGV